MQIGAIWRPAPAWNSHCKTNIDSHGPGTRAGCCTPFHLSPSVGCVIVGIEQQECWMPFFAGLPWFRFILANELGQLSALIQLLHDVAAANQLAVHVELRVGWPGGVLLQSLPKLLVFKDIDGGVGDVEKVQYSTRLVREAAERKGVGSENDSNEESVQSM